MRWSDSDELEGRPTFIYTGRLLHTSTYEYRMLKDQLSTVHLMKTSCVLQKDFRFLASPVTGWRRKCLRQTGGQTSCILRLSWESGSRRGECGWVEYMDEMARSWLIVNHEGISGLKIDFDNITFAQNLPLCKIPHATLADAGPKANLSLISSIFGDSNDISSWRQLMYILRRLPCLNFNNLWKLRKFV